jgi:hypothetical protein
MYRSIVQSALKHNSLLCRLACRPASGSPGFIQRNGDKPSSAKFGFVVAEFSNTRVFTAGELPKEWLALLFRVLHSSTRLRFFR